MSVIHLEQFVHYGRMATCQFFEEAWKVRQRGESVQNTTASHSNARYVCVDGYFILRSV